MKNSIITLLLTFVYASAFCCSFSTIAFCETVNSKTPENVILRGYFSEEMDNGLVFTRLETLRGEEERDEIMIWDNLPFDCNGLHLRKATYLGGLDQEIILSVAVIDTFLYFEGEEVGDYRVPDGIWWETHSLKVIEENVHGYIFTDPYYGEEPEEIPYAEFINQIITTKNCTITSTQNPSVDKFRIYPTLVSEWITIEMEPSLEVKQLDIYSITGQKVATKDISKTIHLGTLEKGMYIIVVEKSKNNYYQQKIVKF